MWFDSFGEVLLLELHTAESSEETAIIDSKKFAADDETSDRWLWLADSEFELILSL